ncbi:alpha/beta hydrolase [Shimia marina]|uniref:Alpha/beta hydrolase family protein n=1 Tax=Shimia marina TaxID=321267 RepID=A0A0P1ER14_9RHOB|nr:alpha/beta hydrolase [Shimia marina]CUH52709.1 Alpha/beta hydrolase family protein [Shimia marina]SFE81986.1 Esterase/lipase [Shimia marina]
MSKHPTAEQMAIIQAMAQGNTIINRTPVLKTPADYGMDYEDVFFPALDGVPLEAWFIPAEGSDKLIICNHPLTFSRYGFPGHLEPWSQFAPVNVEFGKIYKALHDAGYNALTYDMRNHGHSGAANAGLAAYGLFEWRDVAGAQVYVQSHERLKDMTVGLFNPCNGGNSAMVAMSKCPDLFEDVRAFVCPQPCSSRTASEEIGKLQGIGEFIDLLDREQQRLGAFPMARMTPHHFAANVTVPTYVIQVKDDLWTRPEDVQTTYDLLGTPDKKLLWVEGTTRRFDGYNYFGENPESMVAFFDEHMA